MDEHAWQRKSAAILTDIKAWRRAHPKATFVEIEDEVHQRLMQLSRPILLFCTSQPIHLRQSGAC